MEECNNILENYNKQLKGLKYISSVSESRVIFNQDDLFFDNVNFFVKNYLISLCSFLEAYLTEVAKFIFEMHCQNINTCNVPKKFVYSHVNNWDSGKNGIKDIGVECFNIDLKKGINNFFDKNKLSGNVEKTFRVFNVLGVDLEGWIDLLMRDQISNIVSKRNDIIHHNNNAIDVSFGDIASYIDIVAEYMEKILSLVNASNYLRE